MNTKNKHGCRRALAMLLVLISVMSLFSIPAFAGQEDGYHDPAERWMNASNRTNELDVNATVTRETFHCYICKQPTSFEVWRTPEYTKDGQTAMSRNIRYSDGTLLGGTGTGTILDGTPGINATYTGYHWTKACCETCGTMNANLGLSDYALAKNVYWLYDCATAFTEYLDDVVTYEYVDAIYHKKNVDGGNYCEFCYGTRHTHSLTNEYPFAKTSIPMLCGSTSQSSWCAMIRFAESDRTCCKCRGAPDMAMTTGMTMVLPSSHSPAMQDHAMGAALSERQGGETPVRQNSYLPLSDFRESVIDSSAPGVEDK